MVAFLINLDKNPERLAAADAQLRGLGVDYERFPAVYGKALSREERRRKVRRFRSWCAMGRRLMDGEIGCALSHCGVYQEIVRRGLPCAAVLEDDCKLSPVLPEALREVEEWVDPTRPQVVLLTHHQGEAAPPANGGGHILEVRGEMFTEGYVVTLAGARALLAANFPLITVADAWGRWVRQGDIRLYKRLPPAITQDWERFPESDINEARRFRVNALPWWRWGFHKLSRCFGVAVDRAMEAMRKVRKGD